MEVENEDTPMAGGGPVVQNGSGDKKDENVDLLLETLGWTAKEPNWKDALTLYRGAELLNDAGQEAAKKINGKSSVPCCLRSGGEGFHLLGAGKGRGGESRCFNHRKSEETFCFWRFEWHSCRRNAHYSRDSLRRAFPELGTPI